MKVYSLTQLNGGTYVGCYGVFSTPAKATEYAIQKKPCGMVLQKLFTAMDMSSRFGNTVLTKPIDPNGSSHI